MYMVESPGDSTPPSSFCEVYITATMRVKTLKQN